MPNPDFEKRLNDYLENDLDEAGRAALGEEMERDPAAATAFDEALRLEALLVAAHGDGQVEGRVIQGLRKRLNQSKVIHGVPFRWWVAAAAAVVVVAGLLWVTLHQPSQPVAVSHTVESGQIVVRDGVMATELPDGVSFRVGGTLPAAIRLHDGSRVELAPGSEGAFRGSAGPLRQAFVLKTGQGVFQVTNGGGRFRVETSLGSITVLGTEFSVALRPAEESEATSNHTENNMTNKTKAVMALAVAVTVGNVQLGIGGKTYTLWAGQTAYAAEGRQGTEGKVESLVMEGWIHSGDLKAGALVLGGKNESQTTFRFGVKTGDREAEILLDGKRANFQTAIKPGRKASVTYVTVGNDRWLSKVEVTSAAKQPDRVREPVRAKQPDRVREPDRAK